MQESHNSISESLFARQEQPIFLNRLDICLLHRMIEMDLANIERSISTAKLYRRYFDVGEDLATTPEEHKSIEAKRHHVEAKFHELEHVKDVLLRVMPKIHTALKNVGGAE